MNRTVFSVLATVLFLAAPFRLQPATQTPAISYFTSARDIHISKPDVQNYFVVDEEIWKRSQPDLGDLRIYDGQAQVQYALSVQRGGTSNQEEGAKILNLGSVSGRTEFDLDMGKIAEYDRVRLNLAGKDFVVAASVAGNNNLGERPGTHLPPSTLYDFTREQLGSNSVLKLPASSFRYLHVILSPGISPQEVKGASVSNQQETKAVWTSVGSCGPPSQAPRTTVITCEVAGKVPVERIHFQVESAQANFRRAISVSANGQHEYGGEITRVRINRAGTAVVSEEMDVPVAGQSGQLKIVVDNGDNPPLAIAKVQLLSLERRIYFDPPKQSSLKLYYGDSN